MSSSTATISEPSPSTDTTEQQQQQQQQVIAMAESIPKILARSFLVVSVPTDAWIQLFSDRIVVGVSQLDCKIGTYVLCEAVTSESNPRQVEYHVSTLLGNRDDILLGVYARTIHERLRQIHQNHQDTPTTIDTTLPSVILLGISLDKDKGTDPKMFRLLVDLLVDMYVDAIKEPE